MRKGCNLFVVFMGLLLTAVTAWECPAADAPAGALIIRGSNAMAGLVDEWAKAFLEANPGARIMVSGGGTTAGFEALFDKTTPLIMATRKINEKEIQAATLSGIKYSEMQICRDGIAVIANPGNPVRELTIEQLKKIWTGDYTHWKDVGGLDEPILVVTSDQTSGTALFLRSRVMDDGYFTGDARVRDFYNEIIKDVSRTKPAALGYCSFSDAAKAEKNKLVKIMAIKKDEQSTPAVPSADSIRSGSYPLIMPLYLYWNAASSSALVKQFVDFCKSKCQFPQ
jgi:phosphate transport system substrate-binding protein